MRLLKLLCLVPLVGVMGFWASALPVGVSKHGSSARITCSQGIFGNQEWQCRQEALKICGPGGRVTDMQVRTRPALFEESQFSKSSHVTTWIYQLEGCTY